MSNLPEPLPPAPAWPLVVAQRALQIALAGAPACERAYVDIALREALIACGRDAVELPQPGPERARYIAALCGLADTRQEPAADGGEAEALAALLPAAHPETRHAGQ